MAKILFRMDPHDMDSILLDQDIKLSTDYLIVAEIACTRSPLDLLNVKITYQTLFKTSLEEELAQFTEGNVRNLLVSLVGTFRYVGEEVDTKLSKYDAQLLHQKIIVEKNYSDEDFIRIITTRSRVQLNTTLIHYKNEFGNELEEDLLIGPQNIYMNLLTATIKCMSNPHKYLADVLSRAMSKEKFDQHTITRKVATRTPLVKLGLIAHEYEGKTGVSLRSAITELSGIKEYQIFLLQILPDGFLVVGSQVLTWNKNV